jgi:hypothetical protein
MAISNATRLSDFGSGIGTQGAVLNVNNTNKTVGIGTTDPQAMLQVGQNITMDGGASGVITATSFEGSGANLTGISAGLGTALSATQGTLDNLVYTASRNAYIGGGTSAYLNSDTTAGGMLFTRLAQITIGSGSTVHIGAGTTLRMNVLNIF